MEKMYKIFWFRLPKIAGRVLAGTGTLADGAYLTAWPGVIAALPIGLFLLGTLIGSLRLGTGRFFSESIVLVSLFIIVGGVAAHLGFWFCLGYTVGDFVFFRPLTGPIGPALLRDFLFSSGAALLQYALCGTLAVGIPVVISYLHLLITLRLGVQAQCKKWTRWLIRGAIAGLLLYLWTSAYPAQAISIYRLARSVPSPQAMITIIRFKYFFVVEAFAIGVFRGYLESIAFTVPGARNRLIQFAAVLGESKRSAKGVPLWLRTALKVLVMTVMLSALYTAWWQGLILFLAVSSTLLISGRELVRMVWSDIWIRRTGVLTRLVVASLGNYCIGLCSILLILKSSSSILHFGAILTASVGSVTFVSVLLPSAERSASPR